MALPHSSQHNAPHAQHCLTCHYLTLPINTTSHTSGIALFDVLPQNISENCFVTLSYFAKACVEIDETCATSDPRLGGQRAQSDKRGKRGPQRGKRGPCFPREVGS